MSNRLEMAVELLHILFCHLKIGIWHFKIKRTITSKRFELGARIGYHSESFTEPPLSGKLQPDRSEFVLLSDFRALVGKIHHLFGATIF